MMQSSTPRTPADGRRAAVLLWLAALLHVLAAPVVVAQPTVVQRGSVAAVFDALPAVDARELRVRVEETLDAELTPEWSVRAASWVEGLVGQRAAGTARDLVVQPGEIYVRHSRAKADVTVGFQRVVWGTLDELQPTDRVNPIDVGRFLMDGRSEARLPVFAVRGRVYLPGDTTVDAVYVPWFRRGRYDLLDEQTSPFNLLAPQCQPEACVALSARGDPTGLVLMRDSVPPARTAANGSLGARLTRPISGVDVGVSVYRGWQAFPLVVIRPAPGSVSDPTGLTPVVLQERWPRITMIGADAESARGVFTWRAEAALLVETRVQGRFGEVPVDGRSVELGGGLDHTVGTWRTFANVMVRRAWATDPSSGVPADGEVQLVAGSERRFARETRLLRGFAVVNPDDGTAFLRAVAAWNLRDNLWLEGTGAWFAGTGTDFLGQYTDRDLVAVRVRYYF
jgi:hypothetical protein